MIISQKSKDKYLNVISSLIGNSNTSAGADLISISCNLRKEIAIVLPVLKELIIEGKISVKVIDYSRNKTLTFLSPKKQINILNNALTSSAQFTDVLSIKTNFSVKFLLNDISSANALQKSIEQK